MPEENDEELAEGASAKAIWSGTVTFGLVSVPVEILPANRPQRVRLHMVSEEGTPLKRRYFSGDGEKELSPDEIVRGYEIEKGKFVVVEDDELERLAPERTRDIDLQVFVKLADVDPMYFERAYYLTPAGGSNKGYRLLAAAMEETGRAGIATFVMRGKEYLAAVIAENGILRVETLRFADELRTPEDLGLPKRGRVKGADTKRMQAQVRKLEETSLDKKELVDRTEERLLGTVKKKLKKGKDVVELPAEGEEEDSSDVLDLMAALQRSLRSGGAQRAARSRPAAKRASRRKRATAR